MKTESQSDHNNRKKEYDSGLRQKGGIVVTLATGHGLLNYNTSPIARKD
jgi:hypothetical protein